MKKIISLAKRRGFVFQSSEIYGGVEALWDFGPLGAALKDNIKKEWMRRFVQQMPNVVAIQGSIIMHPDVWRASGHLENFTDPLVDCKECKNRYRADHMEEGQFVNQGKAKEIGQCPKCGSKEFTEAKNFNLMFKTHQGVVEGKSADIYLRPETAQGIFINFKKYFIWSSIVLIAILIILSINAQRNKSGEFDDFAKYVGDGWGLLLAAWWC